MVIMPTCELVHVTVQLLVNIVEKRAVATAIELRTVRLYRVCRCTIVRPILSQRALIMFVVFSVSLK